MKRVTSFAIAIALSLGATAFAQQPAATDAARQDSVVKQAMRTYQQGLNDIKEPASSRAVQPGTSSGDFRELRLEEAVSLALEKNLDIQVAKLEPQSVDFPVAGFRNSYRPALSSTFGMRDQYQLPTSTLNGGTKVNNGTATYNFGLSQNVSRFGGAFTVNWSNSRVNTSNTFSTFNPSFQTNLVGAFTQPLLRGFKIDNTRQQLMVSLINREVSEESARATVTQTLANVRNAYWDLVFAQSAVEVAHARARSSPTSSSKTTRRASKSARSRRSTSSRRRRKPQRAGRTSRPPKRRHRPPNWRSSATSSAAPTTRCGARRCVRSICPR